MLNTNNAPKTLRLYTFESQPLNPAYCTLELHSDRRFYTTQLLYSLLDLIRPKKLIDTKIFLTANDVNITIHFQPSRKKCNYALFSSRRLKERYSYSSIFMFDKNIKLFNI